jgi:coproporphyrinogen III oxidase-like Fe-S oxidoreductase
MPRCFGSSGAAIPSYLAREGELYCAALKDTEVVTVYFGGGTTKPLPAAAVRAVDDAGPRDRFAGGT